MLGAGRKTRHQEHLSQYDALAAELDTISIQHAESIDIEKALHEKIKVIRLRSWQDINSKQEIKIIQKEIESEKEKRRLLKIKSSHIKETMQELKDSGLNGSRINGCRPTSSTPTPTKADNPPPHNLTIPNVNIQVPSRFTILCISIFETCLKGPSFLDNLNMIDSKLEDLNFKLA